jgi:dihydrofolate reductase
MAKLIYPGIMSLDGYIADRVGRFTWSAPDEEVHTAINELTRSVGTFLLGRRMYEVLTAWERLDVTGHTPAIKGLRRDLADDRQDRVYSTTLATASTARTRIETEFRPDAVRQKKAAAERDISVGGPCPTRSRPDWSTNTICSSIPSPSVVARRIFPVTPASSSSW